MAEEQGGDHVRGKQGYGHCSDHQFKVGGCKDKASCPFWHMPNQEGRFVHIKCPDTGKAPCPKFAKTGKCDKQGCELAHMEVEGAKPKHYTPRSKGQSRVRVRVDNSSDILPTINVVEDPDLNEGGSDEDDESVLESFVMHDMNGSSENDGGDDEIMMSNDEKHDDLKNEFSEKHGVKIKLNNSLFWELMGGLMRMGLKLTQR